MAKVVRFGYPNRLLALTPSSIVASSTQPGFGAAALLRPAITEPLRTKIGWTFTAANNKIDARIGASDPPFVATIAVGHYATGAAVAAAVEAAFEAGEGGGADYTVTYTGANKFQIVRSGGVVWDLFFGTGANAAFSPALDLGYSVADILGGSAGLPFLGSSVSYQSRHSINIDLLAAERVGLGVLLGHNISNAGFAALQTDTASLVTLGYRDFSTPDVNVALAGDEVMRSAFFTPASYRYLRLIIEDVQNPLGYAELGILFVSDYGQPSVVESIDYAEEWEPLGSIEYADDGAQLPIPRPDRLVRYLLWQLTDDADVAIFEALNALGIGTPFMLARDAVDDPTDLAYVFMRKGLRKQWTQGTYWAVPLELAEVL